jgi:TetR/AcrR family transcriptional regulator, repressor for uid operon
VIAALGKSPSGREAQRIETRRRVFEAAVAEFQRSGAEGADVGAIAQVAGVARGTFYFHFPSKEHVLVELEQREEARIAEALARFGASSHGLASLLDEIVRLILEVEHRIGDILFKDVLRLHFRSRYPASDQWRKHPLLVSVIDLFRGAQERGEIYAEGDAVYSAVFFMMGLYALLATNGDPGLPRKDLLDRYLAGAVRGLEPR